MQPKKRSLQDTGSGKNVRTEKCGYVVPKDCTDDDDEKDR